METTNYMSIISVIASILGLLSASTTILSSLFSYFKQRKTLEEIDSKLFKQAIASADIKQLGNYLDKNIGNVTIKEFSTNQNIQKKVNHYIQSIITFIGTEEDIKKTGVESHETEIVNNNDIPKDFYPIIKELRLGQPWNALAQLRRHIEISLRDFLKQYSIETKEFMPITQTLSMLGSMNLISSSSIRDLKYAVSICNRAVHGIDTSIPEAEEAIQMAIRALNEIDKNKKSEK